MDAEYVTNEFFSRVCRFQDKVSWGRMWINRWEMNRGVMSPAWIGSRTRFWRDNQRLHRRRHGPSFRRGGGRVCNFLKRRHLTRTTVGEHIEHRGERGKCRGESTSRFYAAVNFCKGFLDGKRLQSRGKPLHLFHERPSARRDHSQEPERFPLTG